MATRTKRPLFERPAGNLREINLGWPVPGAALILILALSYLGAAPVILYGEEIVGAKIAVTGDGDALRQVIFILIFGALLAYSYAKNGLKVLINVPVGLAAVVAWCWLSLAWSIAPDVAIRRLVFLTIVVLSLVYCVQNLTYERVILLLAAFSVAFLIFDWIAILVFPLSVHQSSELEKNLIGVWRGIHNHKNEAGPFCAITCMLFVHLTTKMRSYITGPIVVVMSAVFLGMTSSKTSIAFVFISMFLGACAQVGMRFPRMRNRILIATVVAGLLVLILGGDTIDAFLVTFDDPSSLTGRVQIWPVMLRYAADHFWLGAGYGSFWATGDISPIYNYASGWLLTINHAHSGYLNTLVQVGSVGLALTLSLLVIRTLFVLFFVELSPGRSRWLLCSVLTFIMLHNLLESSLLDRANPIWVMMVIFLCLLWRSEESPDHASSPT